MKVITLILCLVALPVATLAQQPSSDRSPREKSSMTITIPGMNCSTTAGASTFSVFSYSWGASNPATFGGGTPPTSGRVAISSLNVMRQFDSCSPVLFDAVSNGTFYKVLTLTQRNLEGDAVSIIALENVLVESWQLSSSTGGVSATESLSFAAQKFCVTDVPSGNKFCYDVVLQKVL